MRILEQSEYLDEDHNVSLENRLRATLDHGFGWYGLIQSQKWLSERLQRHLSDEYTLIRNARLPSTDLIVPLILLGPQGVRAILTTDKRGIFRAKGEEWLSFSGRTRKFRRARPNLLELARSYAQALHAYLQSHGVPLPEVEPVIAVTNPRTHIDTANPSVRIIQADAFEHFASNLQKFQPIMDYEDVQELTGLILEPQLPEPEPEPERETSDELLPSEEPSMTDVDAFRLEDSPAERERRSRVFGMTRSQLIVLGLLLIMELLVLFVFGAIIYVNNVF
jgi:hypothetical protein